MKIKIKVFFTVFMIVTLMTSATALAATSMVKQGNPTSFDLNTIAEEDEENLWIKVSTVWDETLSMYDATSLPEGTLAIAVTFEIKDFDQDSTTMYWAGDLAGNGKSVSVWDDTMPTDTLTVNSDGTYMLVFDAQKVFDGSLEKINSLQIVLPCKSADDATNTSMKFKSIDVVAITDASELDQYTTTKIESNNSKEDVATDTDHVASDDTSTPKTGDTSSPIVYVLLAITAASIGTIIIISEKKKSYTK